MDKKFCIRLLLASLSVLSLSGRAQTIFPAVPVSLVHTAQIDAELTQYQLFQLDSRALSVFLQKNPTATLALDFGGSHYWSLQIAPTTIRSQQYQLQMVEAKGARLAESSPLRTFAGQMNVETGGAFRLSVAEGFVYGAFQIGATTWFIEPAQGIAPAAAFDTYLLYRAADVRPQPGGRCAATEMEYWQPSQAREDALDGCVTIGIALAADYQMYQDFADLQTLENYVLGVLNNVHLNYANDFAQTIRFEAVTLYAITCPDCDPWPPLTNYLQLLGAFRNWGNAGGFGVPHQVASLWTGRVLDNNIGGGAYFGGICSNLRYNVLRRYSSNAALMRSLQAHELGHNFNARHDPEGTPFIMAPIIRDVQQWSVTSRNVINAFLAILQERDNCLGACLPLVVPQAAFTADAQEGCVPLTVQFTNKATDANSWVWTFADSLSSLDANPIITFTEPGIYSVQLAVSNPVGRDTLRQAGFIAVKNAPVANFSSQIATGSSEIVLTNQTTDAERYTWHFGDGNSSAEASPAHRFATDGTYTVQLIAQNACGTDTATQSVTIITAPAASFSAQRTSGCAPLSVQFINQSSANATDFSWQFPGGVPAQSTEAAPIVTYPQAGTYRVTLTARNAVGNAVVSRNNYIRVQAKPRAAFRSERSENEVTFVNQSQSATTYHWDFGDGNTSPTAQPNHIYRTPGTFLVTLIAGNTCGFDTIRQSVAVTGAPPAALFRSTVQTGCAPLMVHFSDLSFGNVQNRRWYFPGGEPINTTVSEPVVTYSQPGFYPVGLVVENFWGRDSIVLENYIEVADIPTAAFMYQLAEATLQLQPDTIGSDWEYAWDFGDGNTSNLPTPTHTYTRPGGYELQLAVRNACGEAIEKQELTVAVPTFVEQPLWLDVWQIAPNPNEGNFQMYLQGKPQRGLTLRLLNSLGQELQRLSIDLVGTWQSEKMFAAYALPAGRYWLTLSGADGTAIRSFVVQKR
ncbi:MAG TPA: PKD domain-containing protein [Saprospiraceae bacterium]|nr:PKD domain-containing protein [Saprospiraceae bacterium]HMP22922.1 PKD domain-containing protein [Saprospiraceae bacterium]